MNRSEKLTTIGEQLLPTIAYGDAAGLPYEGQKPTGQNTINQLNNIDTNPYVGIHPAGTWSDDTHLSIATARALIDADQYDLASIARSHITALEHSEGAREDPDYVPPILTDENHTSWGGSTTNSVKRLQQGVSPRFSGEKFGWGNGVLMKMAPLVYWQLAQRTPLAVREEELRDYTQLTHQAPEVVVSSLVHARLLNRLFEAEPGQCDERDFRTDQYITAMGDAYTLDQYFDPDAAAVSTTLERLAEPVMSRRMSYEKIIEAAEKRGFRAPETLMMAYGSFILNAHFPKAVYRTVEMGGDSDSTGSILATMLLFAHGSLSKPHDYEKLHDIERLERVSRQLAQAAIKR